MIPKSEKFEKNDRIAWAIIAAWFAVHAYLAHHRSIWVDEWLHFEQITWPIKKALQTLFEEISPFAPGQLMLGRLFHAITGGFPSLELSGRLSSLLLGALTVLTAFRMRLRILPVMVMFSVALCAMSTQSRPYSALIFAAAVSYKLIWDRRPLDRIDSVLAWFAIFFGHIYGICYVVFACFLRRDWKKATVGTFWIGLILWAHVWPDGKLSPFDKSDVPDIFAIIKLTMGAIGNPYKASWFFGIFACIGLMALIQQRRLRLLLELAAYFLAVVGGPIIADVISGYYFSPRQIVGGMFSFMALSAYGMEMLLLRHSYSKPWLKPTLTALFAAASIGPWVAFVNGTPPFIDQPLSKVKTILQEAIESGDHNVLWADSGLASTAKSYLNLLIEGETPHQEFLTLSGFNAEKTCYTKKPICLYTLISENQFTHNHTQMVNESPAFAALLESKDPKFDLLVHTARKFELKTPIKTRRTY